MPAQIVTGSFCADYFATFKVAGSKPGVEYTVTCDGLQMRCTCPAYRFSPSDDPGCKHCDQVFKGGCFWNEQWCDGNALTIRPVELGNYPQIPGETCPHCGGPVCPVKIAV